MRCRSRFISSSAENGSSISMMAGSNTNALAIAARCCMPPDSCPGYFVIACPSPNVDSSSAGSRRARPGVRLGVDAHRQFDVLAHGLPRQQCGGLRHEADLLVSGRCRDALAVDRDGARVGVEETGDHLEQRGLAAAARADHRHELAHADRETHVVEHGDLRAVDAEGLRDVPDFDACSLCEPTSFACQIRCRRRRGRRRDRRPSCRRSRAGP